MFYMVIKGQVRVKPNSKISDCGGEGDECPGRPTLLLPHRSSTKGNHAFFSSKGLRPLHRDYSTATCIDSLISILHSMQLIQWPVPPFYLLAYITNSI